MIATIVLLLSAAALLVVATVRREHRVDARGGTASDPASRFVTVAALLTSGIAAASALLYMVDRL
ncbi:hypothetical protein [Gordonia terrae]